MALENFDQLLALVPKKAEPLRAVLAGPENENMLQGIFMAQEAGIIHPVLVGNRDHTLTLLDKLGLADRPYTMITADVSVANASVDVIRSGEGDILMRGEMLSHNFLVPVVNGKHGLRRGNEYMSHVTLASLPEYPRLLALADMAVIIDPDVGLKRTIIKNTVTALKALGYDNPVLAMMALVEKGTFQMEDTVEAQSLVFEQTRRPIADCTLWGPISYDLIISKESARLKNYECPYTGAFDGIIAPELTTANTLLKSWTIHAGATVCGAIIGAQVPIALTSRFVAPKETFLSLAFCAILDDYYKKIGWK